jgi:lysine-N-methylase
MAGQRDVRLPIVTLAMPEQRYSCHGCGNCCRDFTVQLRPDDLRRLAEQRWEERLGEPVTVEFRGQRYLRQREDGACVFWLADGRCRIHAEFGFEEKPIACQLFPFTVVPGERDAAMGVNFACGSVQESKGAALGTHRAELLRMVGRAPETVAAPAATSLLPGSVATALEVDATVRGLDRWLCRADVPAAIRFDGLAWLAQSLVAAKLAAVRGSRYVELIDTLVGALPDELAHLPTDPATSRQRAMLRQAVFARVEDPKIPKLARESRWRTTLRQLVRSRRFSRGRGAVPAVGPGWPEAVPFAAIEAVAPPWLGGDLAANDELLTRWLRATIHGRRAWGPGYYGWSIPMGLASLTLNLAAVAWLARLRAAGREASECAIGDVRAGLGRVDRVAGRAPWLGSRAEDLRIRWLAIDDGLRRILGRG